MTQETTVEERVMRTEDRVDRVLENMATKDDIRNMATKDDIRNMATKDDIRNMATKDDIRNMATKDDIRNMATKDDIRNMATKDDIGAVRGEIKILHDRLNVAHNHHGSWGSYSAFGTFILTRFVG